MLLVCPSCNSRYVVPDAAIGADGRQVRCANCKHSWHQQPVVQPAPPAPPVAAPRPIAETAAEAADQEKPESEAVAAPVASPTAAVTESAPKEDSVEAAEDETPSPAVQQGFSGFDETVEQANAAEPTAPPAFAESPPPEPPHIIAAPEDHSQFAHEPPFKPRRNPAKLWTMAAIAFALSIVLVGGALSWFGVPGGSFNSAAREPDLKIVLNDNLDLGEKDDGTPYFIASGSIVNPTSSDQDVPAILITLKAADGRPVYSWKLKPKVSHLGPGEKVDFSELRFDVPLASARISASWMLDK